MCTVCIQAKHKQNIIKVKTKHTTKPFELIHSDVCGPFSTPTSTGHCYYILILDEYTPFTSVQVVPDMMSKTCTAAYKSFQEVVGSMGYQVKRSRCDNGSGEYDNNTFRLVLSVHGKTYEPCPLYLGNDKWFAEYMIETIPEIAWSIMNDSQVPLEFPGEAINTTKYIHLRTSKAGLMKRHNCTSYQVPYRTAYEMLHAFDVLPQFNGRNKILYKTPVHQGR